MEFVGDTVVLNYMSSPGCGARIPGRRLSDAKIHRGAPTEDPLSPKQEISNSTQPLIKHTQAARHQPFPAPSPAQRRYQPTTKASRTVARRRLCELRNGPQRMPHSPIPNAHAAVCTMLLCAGFFVLDDPSTFDRWLMMMMMTSKTPPPNLTRMPHQDAH